MTPQEARQLGWGKRAFQFAYWMRAVDEELDKLTGFTHADFEDWNWADSFEAGDLPADAVRYFLEDVAPELLEN